MRRIAPGWLHDLEVVSRAALGKNIETHYYILTIQHQIFRALESAADVRFQYAVAMAYGFTAFSAFTYPSQGAGWGNGLVTQRLKNGTWTTRKHRSFEYVRIANEELLRFDHIYLSFRYLGTMVLYGEKNIDRKNECFAKLCNPLRNLDGIAAIESEYDALIGSFTDDYGNRAYMVVNFTEPSRKLQNSVAIRFESTRAARVYERGIPHDYETEENVLRMNLRAGEGVFVLAAKS